MDIMHRARKPAGSCLGNWRVNSFSLELKSWQLWFQRKMESCGQPKYLMWVALQGQTLPASGLYYHCMTWKEGGHSRIPAKVLRVDVQDTCPGHSRWCGSPQMADLEKQPDGGCEGDTLIAGQRQDLSREGATVSLVWLLERFKPRP